MILNFREPRGAETSTISPFFLPMIALPTGDSLESLLSARVITKREISKDTVSIGSHVRIKDMEKGGKTFEYRIVGSAEANPAEIKLSNESPVGKAIMGKKKGEIVEVSAPRGARKFKIMEIKAA